MILENLLIQIFSKKAQLKNMVHSISLPKFIFKIFKIQFNNLGNLKMLTRKIYNNKYRKFRNIINNKIEEKKY